jgi:pro-apoptotic serine protease NMA111
MFVVSRNTVPAHICDVWVDFGNRNFSARVIYLGIFTVVTINGTIPKTMQPIKISSKEVTIGDKIDIFSLDSWGIPFQKSTTIREIAGTYSGPHKPPRWRIHSQEAIYPSEPLSVNDGVLIDPEDKTVVALWILLDSIRLGLDYKRYIQPIIETLQKRQEYENRCCGWLFIRMTVTNGLQLGLSDERAIQIFNHAKKLRIPDFLVRVSTKLRPLILETLQVGDIILEINGNPVLRMRDVEELSRNQSSKVLVIRERKEIIITVNSKKLPSELSSKVIFWAGAYLHETHDPALEQIPPEFEKILQNEGITDIQKCVYISGFRNGSPASIGLTEFTWMLEVDGHKVRSMDDMLDVISILKGVQRYLTVKVASIHGFLSIKSVRLDQKFFPAWMLEYKDEKWVRTELE